MTVNQIASLSSAHRYLGIHNTSALKSLQRLSSGYRINSAADDAAGLAVSEKMRGQIGGLGMAIQNSQNAVSLIQAAEGGLNEVSAILNDMSELAVQASNGTYSQAERDMLNDQFQELKGSLDQIIGSSNYNGMKLLDGSLGGVTGQAGLREVGIDGGISATGTIDGTAKFTITEENGVYSITAQIGDESVTHQISSGQTSQLFTFDDGDITLNFSNAANLETGVITNVGVNGTNVKLDKAVSASSEQNITFQIGANGGADQRMGLNIGDMSSLALGLKDLSIDSIADANKAIDAIKDAQGIVNSQRSQLGTATNRLEHTINNLGVTRENTVASESRIRDTDMASEIMNYLQRNLMIQASQAMMAQGMNLSRNYMMGLLMR